MEEKKVSGTSGESDSGATNDNSRGRSGGSDGRPRMDKLCMLLLPPLRQERDGTGARARASGHSASESTQDIRPSPADRGRNIAVRPWGVAIRSGSRRRTVSSVSSCRSRGAVRGTGADVRVCSAFCATLLACAGCGLRGWSRLPRSLLMPCQRMVME